MKIVPTVLEVFQVIRVQYRPNNGSIHSHVTAYNQSKIIIFKCLLKNVEHYKLKQSCEMLGQKCWHLCSKCGSK